MNKSAVGQEASQSSGEIFFQTYQNLLKQKKLIDKEIGKLQGKLFKALSRQKGLTSEKHVKYVERCKNNTTLAKAIRLCMVPSTEMTMDDILKSLKKKKLYKTNSDYFYTMVNNKLNRDKQIKKVSCGIFVYKPRAKSKKAKAVA